MTEYENAYRKMEEFLDWTERRGRRKATIKMYWSAIRNFIGFLDAEGLHSDPELIGEKEIRHFVNEYLASENTIRDYILCIGVWLRYFHNTVLDTIGLLWNENGCPNAKWISEYEFRKMVNAAHDPTQRMILLLGAKCGLRCGEMSILKDTDFDGSTLTVTGKGHGKGKIRILPLSDFMIAEMKSYLQWKETIKEGRTDRSDGRFLVVTTWRDTHVVSLLSDAIYRKVTAMAAEVGVSCTPHSLRRLFATTMLSHTDLTVVRTLMGHANINTTARYIRNDMNKIREAMNSLGGI